MGSSLMPDELGAEPAKGKIDALVIGSGPAGLMAAETLVRAGRSVTIAEAKPSAGRKLLMAGKSGLNITKAEPREAFRESLWRGGGLACAHARSEFGPREAVEWAEDLGQPVFTGSTGRVFPEVMKASPLLRAWLRRIGAELRLGWRWVGWDGPDWAFDTPEGPVLLSPEVTVLALGGASWRRLGSDGAWADLLAERGVELAPFRPANMGFAVNWTQHMAPHLGQPLKGVRLIAGSEQSVRGEAVISERGIEGGGVYGISAAVRDGAPFAIDLHAGSKSSRTSPRACRSVPKKRTVMKHLATLGLDPVKRALLAGIRSTAARGRQTSPG
jgi:uncharacterized flavoprotein (TIGR03862 family)